MSTNTQDLMSPDASPDQISKKVGVRRVNNMPLYLVGSVMGVFLVVMVVVAADRAAQQNHPAEVKDEKAINTSMFAKAVTGDRKDGIVQPQAATRLVVPELSAPPSTPESASDEHAAHHANAVAIDQARNLDPPLSAPTSSHNVQPQRGLRDDELERIRTTKRQQFEEAVKAKTSVTFTPPRSAGTSNVSPSGAPPTRAEQLERLAAVRQQIDASTRDDPTAAYKARLQQIQTAAVDMPASGRNEDRWKLDSQPGAPHTPYELRAGFVVPATLISGVNSELPGQILAQVSQDVFDTATGKWRLIPQGSRLIGSYSSEVAYGQARMLVAWQRIVFPDGKAMDIGSMPGTDSAGYAGFTDQVNNHFVRLLSSAVLMSGVTAGIALSQPKQTGASAPTASSAMSEALGQQLGQVTTQLITKNMNIAPTLEIRPGYRFNVMVTKDMTFTKPYQPFDY